MMSSGASFALLWKDVGRKEGSPALYWLRDHQGLGAGGAETAGARTVLLYVAGSSLCSPTSLWLEVRDTVVALLWLLPYMSPPVSLAPLLSD